MSNTTKALKLAIDLENEVKRLKALIDKAPHDINCNASQYRGYMHPQPCNCWKSKANPLTP